MMGYVLTFLVGLLTLPALLLLSIIALGVKSAWRKAEKPSPKVDFRWGNN